jgi:hypothetical protein
MTDLLNIPELGPMTLAEFKALPALKVPVSPVLPWFSDADLAALIVTRSGLEKVLACARALIQADELRIRDPLRYGYLLDSWKLIEREFDHYDEIWAMGGNGSAKSWLGAWFGVKALTQRLTWERPAAPNELYDVAFFHSSEDSSTDQQQFLVHQYLPPEWRNLGKSGRSVNVSYTAKNGFSDGKFILPNNARALFFNYRQEVDVIVGYKWNMAVCDELVGLAFLREIRHRLRDRNGRLLVTFTPVDGFTPAVRDVLEGAEVIESQPAPRLPQTRQLVAGCPAGHMPTLMRSRTGKQLIVFLWSDGNPFNDPANLTNVLKGQPEAEVKIRAYGFPERMTGVAFPRYGKPHKVRAEDVPAEGTNYLVVDPRPFVNWFMVWYRVTKDGLIYAYREWPDVPRCGPWAVPSDHNKPDGQPGPGQRYEAGRGLNAYRRLIRELEGSEVVFERIIDPRAGNSKVAGVDEASTLIEMLGEDAKDAEGAVQGMEFVPACKEKNAKDPLHSVQEWIDYALDRPVDATNQPRLKVSEACQNLDYALRTWTNLDGEKGATKDPIDCVKYLAAREPEFQDPQARLWSAGGSY